MNFQKAAQRILIGGGLVSFVLAAALLAGVGLTLPLNAQAVAIVGVLSMIVGLATVRARLRGEVTETQMPNPEQPPSNPPPGDEVDQQLYEMIHLNHGMQENREQIETRLQAAAIRTIRQREDCSRTAALAQLQTGEWIDNEAAARFFTDDQLVEERRGGISALRGADEHQESFKRHVEAVVSALAELGNLEFEPQQDPDPPGLLTRLGFGDGAESDEDVVETNWNVDDSSIESFETEEPFVDLGTHETNRWLGVSAFALLAFGLGAFLSQPGLLLVGCVGVAYAAYARATVTPSTENLVVERSLSEENPVPGEELQVTVRVRNEGNEILPDLRLVDAVPDPFVVTRGSPRLHTALRPGDEATISYTVLVERGEYRWPVLTVARDFSGSTERESLLTPEQQLVCKPPLASVSDTPVRAQTTQYSGDVETDVGGAGLEFHSVRDYRKGDPMNRINWKRFARTGEFATIDFRQERAATVTILFDTRESAFVARGPGEPNAVNLSVRAATSVFTSLYDSGNLVGVAAFDTVPCWLSPASGSKHVERAKLLFATHPALSPIPPSKDNIEGTYIDPMTHVRRQMPANSQVFLFSPLADDYAAETARRLDSAGHLVTIISPDTTSDDTVGQRLARIERRLRIGELRERGIRAIDWNPADRLSLQFERAQARWG